MTNDSGKAYFGIGIDNSQLQADAAEATQILGSIDSEAEKQSAAVRELLTNLPTINLDIISNAGETTQAIDAAFAEIDRVVDTNKAAIAQLEKEYDRLGKEAAKAFKNGDDKTYNELKKQQSAITQVINARKKMNKEAAATADELLKEEQRLKAEQAVAEQAATSHTSLRQRLREVKLELVEMEAAGQRGTAEYKALQAEAAQLTDAFADAQAQASILAHDQAGFQGVISGLSGVTGAMSAAQGAVGLFAGENEHLQKIMLKVQSLMAITMGLQQVQQTLNKDSAFSLVTLNGLKEWWNKLVAVGTGEQIAETAATGASTAAATANAAATTAEAEAKAVAGAASTGKAGAEAVDTAATGANAVAATAGTAANIGLAGAFRMVGAAIASIPVFGWIAAAIGAIVAVVMNMESSAEKAAKAIEEENEMLKEARKVYATASLEVENYKVKLDNFNGTKKEEAALVDELNSKYGEEMGYCKSVAEWKQTLAEKSDAYCDALFKEAEAQAILSKYTEAYLELFAVRAKIVAGEYHHWYNTKRGDEAADRAAEQAALNEIEKWKNQYKAKMQEVANLRADFNLGGHTDPTRTPVGGGGGNTPDKVDPKKAIEARKKAEDDYRKAVGEYIRNSTDELTDLIIDAQDQGITREINEINRNTARKKAAIRADLEALAAARRDYAKQVYMSNGASESDWLNTEDGKKSIDDWIAVLFSEDSNIKKQFDDLFAQVTENGEKAGKNAMETFYNGMVDAYGSYQQKFDKLSLEWQKKFAYIPPEFMEEAARQMDGQFARLKSDRFKNLINWESVFGNLSEQSLPVLKHALAQVQEYFEANKDTMSVTEIKDYQQAIANMEAEIDKRNPFSALINGINGIKEAKADYTAALAEWQTATNELTLANNEFNAALAAQNEILDRIESGELTEGCQEQIDATNRLTAARTNYQKAEEKSAQAEQKVLKARNNITAAYTKAATGFRSCGKVIQDVGGKAKNLASIFSDNVGKSIEKALNFTDEVLDATATIIDSIGDVGKGVAEGVEGAVQASAQGATAAAATGATAMSTVEKASVILTVISAALQIATAIANLFNNDDKKQEKIERLQERIDQLQWELDNADSVRLQNSVGDAVKQLRDIYNQTTAAVLNLHGVTSKSTFWEQWIARARYQADIYDATIVKIADHYANAAYTADKALGGKRYAEARSQLENLAQQQILIQQQIDAENSKKKTDSGKVQDYKNKIAEIAEEMATIINDLVEDIIGGSAEDISDQLGSAFTEACKQGEDAMEAYRTKVNEIVGDIIRRMMIQKYLEPQIGAIFDKYKAKWFPNGNGEGAIDRIIESAGAFANELNAAGETFGAMWEGLSQGMKDYFAPDEETREASQKGIATASQESVDELNGRATAIQGHTYIISENSKLLVATTGQILRSVMNIENETTGLAARMDGMEREMKGVRSAVDDIATKGIKIHY